MPNRLKERMAEAQKSLPPTGKPLRLTIFQIADQLTEHEPHKVNPRASKKAETPDNE